MKDIIGYCSVGMAVYMLISLVAFLDFQTKNREPIKGEWVWLGGMLPILVLMVPIMWALSVLNRMLRGEGLHWTAPKAEEATKKP